MYKRNKICTFKYYSDIRTFGYSSTTMARRRRGSRRRKRSSGGRRRRQRGGGGARRRRGKGSMLANMYPYGLA